MKRSIIQILLFFYPATWRNEYGAELEGLLVAEPLRISVVLNVLWNALREQSRISVHRPALNRALTLMRGAVVTVFLLGMLASLPLWRQMTEPVAEALKQSGRIPMLIQNKPWEAFAVIWLGLPALVTLFVGYPLAIGLIRAKLASVSTPGAKQRGSALLIWSGALSLLSAFGAAITWRNGVALTLHGFEPLMRIGSPTTVSGCFGTFTRSILAFGITLQVPVLALFLFRARKTIVEPRT
jgi:Sec-independent protein secretion pathway component TatC